MSIQQKRECFNKAKNIVEQLLERDVAEEYLLQSVRMDLIHYQTRPYTQFSTIKIEK
jgi:hypothetical protein